jgi:uncharacterized membrane protein YgcG
MKKLIFLLLTVFLSYNSYAQGFTVENYEVDVYIEQEGYFDVVENYDLNFTQLKHGIYRKIYTHYDLENYKGEMETREIDINNIEVPGYKFEATPRFLRKLEGAVNLKIGDPDKTISGPQHYEIKYRVKNAFLFEPTMTRFYWDLKPDQWLAPFQKISFRIHLPEGMSIDLQDCHVYSGYVGNTEKSTDFELAFNDGVLTGTSVAGFNSNYGDAVTVLLNLTPGSINEIKPPWPFWTKHGWMLILGLLVGGFYLLFLKYGKDDSVTTAISFYPPENMDPAMAGFLINDKEDTSDLISLIPYWGAKGHLKMEEIKSKSWFVKNDTKITKLSNLPSDAPNYQKKIFNGLFSGSSSKGVLLSSLKDSFYSTMTSAKAQLKEAAQPYYEPRSRAVKKMTGGLLVLVAVILFPFIFYYWGITAAVIITICCVLLVILNTFMIKKNTRGNAVLSELKGFRQFIKTAEANKLKMLISESPLYFESTMAYALTFGFFEDWVKKFNNLNVKPPEWYSGIDGSHSSLNNFSKSFSSTMSSASSTMVSSPSSSSSSGGGGSSGGGFGGGGGGSW